jgi:hypothetical protein
MIGSPASGIAAISAAALTLALSATGASAADLSGHVAGTQKETASIPLSGDRVAKRMRFKVNVMTDDAANPFNLASQECMATYVFSKDGAPLGGNGYCDGITATGDIWWIRIELGADGMVRWTHLGGTGQLDGITASGTTKNLAEFSDGKVIARFEGTYTSK